MTAADGRPIYVTSGLLPVIASVKGALLHGLQEVFFAGAVLMVIAIVPQVFLKREPLRTRAVAAESVAAPSH